MSSQNQNTCSGKPPLPPSAASSIAAAAEVFGARPPCAACRSERRLCTRRCFLARYFPADEPPEDFDNVRWLFGTNRVAAMLKRVAADRREEAAESIIYEANMRARNPVGGSCAAVGELLRRLEVCQAELRAVEERLAAFKNQESVLPLKKRKFKK